MRRMPSTLRATLLALFAVSAANAAADTPLLPSYPDVRPGVNLRFPADHGAHSAFRTEWWYVTGWLQMASGQPLGFQVTFFRTRPASDARNPSSFAPRQILFAHAALSDPRAGKLLHASRAARAGFGLAEAAEGDAHLVLDDWSLTRSADGRFHAKAGDKDFAFDLVFAPGQPVLLQGENGYSRKGPKAAQASHYYSLPHLAVTGTARSGSGRAEAVTGSAWLDREWSSTLMDSRAVGWDWVALNLDDGSALMAFQMRDAEGKPLWAGGTLRDAKGATIRLQPGDVQFATVRRWRSPRTNTEYPVERIVTARLPGGERQWRLAPLFDDQELDSRTSGGPVYWEGAVKAEGGRGYLELTGYFQPLKL